MLHCLLDCQLCCCVKKPVPVQLTYVTLSVRLSAMLLCEHTCSCPADMCYTVCLLDCQLCCCVNKPVPVQLTCVTLSVRLSAMSVQLLHYLLLCVYKPVPVQLTCVTLSDLCYTVC